MNYLIMITGIAIAISAAASDTHIIVGGTIGSLVAVSGLIREHMQNGLF